MARPDFAGKGGNRKIFALLTEYGSSHQNKQNKLIHWIAVPIIAWTIIALFWSIPVPDAFNAIPYLNWATIALFLTVIYYAALSWTLAIGMVLFAILCIGLVGAYETMPVPGLSLWQFAIIAFVVAWIFQFIGHKIEGKKPSFFKDVQFLLIGPAWLMSFIYRKLGIPI
ncbi:MAG: Mpo1-like protein [Sneathiella sp.]